MKIEIDVELSAPWTIRPITEQDISWPELLKIAQENYKLYTGCLKRLGKARAQKNEWKKKYDELLEKHAGETP